MIMAKKGLTIQKPKPVKGGYMSDLFNEVLANIDYSQLVEQMDKDVSTGRNKSITFSNDTGVLEEESFAEDLTEEIFVGFDDSMVKDNADGFDYGSWIRENRPTDFVANALDVDGVQKEVQKAVDVASAKVNARGRVVKVKRGRV